MDSVDFENNSNIILTISCVDFKLSIAGYKNTKRINSNEQAQLILSGLYSNRVVVKSIGDNGKLIDSKD